MPRTRLQDSVSARKAERKRTTANDLKILIFGTMAAEELSQSELCRRINMAETTLSNRKKDLGRLRVSELLSIGKALDIPVEKLQQAIHY